MRIPLLSAFLLCLSTLFAQGQRPLQESRHGWYLSPHGSIRILLLFAEIEYDVNPGKDPQPNGAEHWPKGQLPKWKDELFDPHQQPIPKAQISRYYHDISLGQYQVLGDYIPQPIILKESEYPTVSNGHGINRLVVTEANKLGALRTQHGLSVADFDNWKRGGKPGLPKEAGPDSPHSYDHVMVILRNSSFTHGQGSVDPGSPGKLFGYESDSQSRFGGMNALPFEILQHEFNHLFLGGNNFHSGGGNAAMFNRYFICMQGGWGMMGGANSSLLTCNAWDRDRMGWMPRDATQRIRARDPQELEVDADLDPFAGDTGIFVLRDFMTTGDALRIRLPFIPDIEYPQWVWLENHQTHARNGVPSDRFHYEGSGDCVKAAVPGIHALLQVARDDRSGQNIFGGHADHLRPLVASGHFDFGVRDVEGTYNCISQGSFRPLVRDERLANPLTGFHDLEFPAHDLNGDGRIDQREQLMLRLEERAGKLHDEAYIFGHARQVFRPDGERRIGMDTNPSMNSQLTLARSNIEMNERRAPDNRTIYLNGLSVELMEQRSNGDIVVRVRNNDVLVRNDVRWCADSIVLHPLNGADEHDLVVAGGRTLKLDRGLSPTRISDPEAWRGSMLFSSVTKLHVQRGASIHLESRAKLELLNNSELHLMDGSSLSLAPGARLVVDKGSRIVLHGRVSLEGNSKALAKLERKGRVLRL